MTSDSSEHAVELDELITLADCPRCQGQGRLFAFREDDTGCVYLHCEECEQGFRDPTRLAANDGFLTLDAPGGARAATQEDVLGSPWRSLLASAPITRRGIADWANQSLTTEEDLAEPPTRHLDWHLGEPVSVAAAASLFDFLVGILCERRVEGVLAILSAPMGDPVSELDLRGFTWQSAREKPELFGVPDLAIVSSRWFPFGESFEEYRHAIDVPFEVRPRRDVHVHAYYRCYGLDPRMNDEFFRAIYVEACFPMRRS